MQSFELIKAHTHNITYKESVFQRLNDASRFVSHIVESGSLRNLYLL